MSASADEDDAVAAVRIRGTLKYTEGDNSAGDRVWMTALVDESGKVIDLGTLLDAFPGRAKDDLVGQRVTITIAAVYDEPMSDEEDEPSR